MLILGESHYTGNPEEVGTTPLGFTSGVVDLLALQKRHQFFGKLQEVVTGKPRRLQTSDDRRGFWRSVAFYNFVPVLIDGRPVSAGGARRRPTATQFQQGIEPFHSIRNELKPTAVIVCGLETWSVLAPSLDGFEGPERDVIYYDDGTAVYARTQHPSWPGFDTEKWYARIAGLIELSAQERQLGWKQTWRAEQ